MQAKRLNSIIASPWLHSTLGAALIFGLTSRQVIAGAQRVKPGTPTLAAIRVDMTLDAAHASLRRLGQPLGGETQTKPGKPETDAREKRQKGEKEETEGGRKEAWTLKTSDFATVAFQADKQDRIVWITGFVWADREIPFARLGDLSRALRDKDFQAVWNVTGANGGYRLIARGPGGKARVVTLLVLAPAANP